MASTAVSLAKTTVEGLLQQVATAAVDELAKVLGVRQEVWYIKGEFEMMQSFLVAAEARHDDNNILRTWVRQVRDLANQIEDCLAEFSLHLENHGSCYRLQTLGTQRRIVSKIRDIRKKVEEVSQRNLRYNLINPLDFNFDVTASYVNLASRMSTFVVEETELIGQAEPKNNLIEMISDKNERLKVIWITGMGGVGKTALVKKVFDCREVSKHFSCRAWVTVSQNFDPKDILKEILKQISENKYEDMRKVEELVQCVRCQLEQNIYLVVLDDLWTTQAWNIIENAFLDNEKGSRVIVTTRNTNVAQHCNWNLRHIYPIEPLSDENSRDLLLRKIYKSNNFSDRHRDLDDVTNKIIRKCRGLPLAIVTIGGLLASKPINKEEWEKLLNCLGSELEANPIAEVVKQILDLSYHDLPYYLKPCLLYLSIFPEDFEIRRSRLVYRWIAEGFVGHRRGMTLEEVAERYFYELINRNLIQPSEVGVDGTVKSCRVHDIMRELLVAKSIEENLIFITDEQENITPVDNVRHLVITRFKEIGNMNLHDTRSVSIFGAHVPSYLSSSSKSKLKLLRILDLRSLEHSDVNEWYKFKQVIRHLGQFKHLKYFSMPEFYGREYRLKSLGILRNLQTLDMKLAKVPKVPKNFIKLRKLRHILVGRASYGWGIAMADGIGNLKELQVLDCVDIKRSHHRVIQDLTKLNQLRRLGVTNLRKEHSELFAASLSELSSLRSLRIRIDSEEVSVDCLDRVSSPSEHLRNIKIFGWIGKLPTWVSSLYNLAKVTLKNTRLDDNAIAVLEKLPNLVLLRLGEDSYVGAKLTFWRDTFTKLMVLFVGGLKNLEELLFEEGTLPELQVLYISDCELKSGISGVKHLRRLNKLALGPRNYVANLDMVQKQVKEHNNRPTLDVLKPRYQKEMEDSYRVEQGEAEAPGPSHSKEE